MPTTKVSIRLNTETLAAVDSMAERFGRTRASFCAMAIEQHLNDVPARAVLLDKDELWNAAEEMAHERGGNLSDLILYLLNKELTARNKDLAERNGDWENDGGISAR